MSDYLNVEDVRTLADNGCLYATTDRAPALVIEEAAKLLSSKGRLLARMAINGQRTGHEFCYCSRCGELRLMEPTGLKQADQKKYTEDPPAAHPYCKMTPGCLGHMVRIAKRPVLTKRLREVLDADRGYVHAVEG